MDHGYRPGCAGVPAPENAEYLIGLRDGTFCPVQYSAFALTDSGQDLRLFIRYASSPL